MATTDTGVEITRQVSALGAMLITEAQARYWSLPVLSAMAGVPASTIFKIVNTPGIVPSLRTLNALATALDKPLRDLIAVCGFNVDQPAEPEPHKEAA